MSTAAPDSDGRPPRLRTARVLRVAEGRCEVSDRGVTSVVGFASMFPTPHVERVSPGHLVAIASGPADHEVVVWRWYDAVVVGTGDDGSVRLWEPAHGEVSARARASYEQREPGTRAWASAGLPGADWWVAGTDVELDAVASLYTENGLWSSAFGAGA